MQSAPQGYQSQERYGGFAAGMGAAGLPLRSEWTPSEKTTAAAKKLLSRNDLPAEELYATHYRAAFGLLPLPPTMTWSISDLARLTIARLAERRTHPEMPPALFKIPAHLKLPTENISVEKKQ